MFEINRSVVMSVQSKLQQLTNDMATLQAAFESLLGKDLEWAITAKKENLSILPTDLTEMHESLTKWQTELVQRTREVDKEQSLWQTVFDGAFASDRWARNKEEGKAIKEILAPMFPYVDFFEIYYNVETHDDESRSDLFLSIVRYSFNDFGNMLNRQVLANFDYEKYAAYNMDFETAKNPTGRSFCSYLASFKAKEIDEDQFEDVMRDYIVAHLIWAMTAHLQ